MASLIGINWPANSVGVLPDVDHTQAGFLDPHGGEETLARMALVNTQVLLEHYRIKHGMLLSVIHRADFLSFPRAQAGKYFVLQIVRSSRKRGRFWKTSSYSKSRIH